MERWENRGELRTEGCTVPTSRRKRHVDLWVGKVESAVLCRIDGGAAEVGFATWRTCPQFAQGFGEWWKIGLEFLKREKFPSFASLRNKKPAGTDQLR